MQPIIGLGVWTVDEGMFARWDGGAWVTGIVSAAAISIGGEQIIGSRQPAIANPEGGGTADVEARTAIGSILDAMRAHGLFDGPGTWVRPNRREGPSVGKEGV